VLPEIPPANILVEPVGRNTAACVGLAAHAVLSADDDGVCVVLPADHLIGEEDSFRSAMAAGATFVERHGGLLTFGIRPTRAETGYGYLEVGEERGRGPRWAVHHLQRFVEKPDSEKAEAYVSAGGFLWNAGIFAWRARDLLDEVSRQLPELGAGLDRIGREIPGEDLDGTLAQIYPSLPATSVDFGIMEGARRCWVMPVDFPWSDVGSWLALADELPLDDSGNASRGRVQTMDSTGNVLVSTGPVVSAVGVEGLVVVATPDAVLVIPKEQAQRVKDIVDGLREKGWDDVL
jgi:mannose-1-phosphate guanylyltransferase